MRPRCPNFLHLYRVHQLCTSVSVQFLYTIPVGFEGSTAFEKRKTTKQTKVFSYLRPVSTETLVQVSEKDCTFFENFSLGP